LVDLCQALSVRPSVFMAEIERRVEAGPDASPDAHAAMESVARDENAGESS
jgi:hypothetical protein